MERSFLNGCKQSRKYVTLHSAKKKKKIYIARYKLIIPLIELNFNASI